MQIFKHKTHTAYHIKKNIVIIRNHEKIKFYFPRLCIFRGIQNIYFSFRPHKQFKYTYWTIRTPIFYWDRNNGGFKIGLPNLYLWVIK